MADARLTPLGVVVLGLLREQPMHPYEIMRLIRQRRDDRLVAVSNGTLYHTVERLEQHAYIVEVGVDREGNRPERTTYALTDAGRAASAEWVRRELPRIDHPAAFRVALAEAHELDREDVIDLLQERRIMLTSHAGRLRDGLARAARVVPLQFLVEGERELALIDADLAWSDGLLARLADLSLAWGIDELPTDTKERLAALRESAIS